MNEQDPIRQAFETVCYPNFPGQSHGLRRKPSGESAILKYFGVEE